MNPGVQHLAVGCGEQVAQTGKATALVILHAYVEVSSLQNLPFKVASTAFLVRQLMATNGIIEES